MAGTSEETLRLLRGCPSRTVVPKVFLLVYGLRQDSVFMWIAVGLLGWDNSLVRLLLPFGWSFNSWGGGELTDPGSVSLRHSDSGLSRSGMAVAGASLPLGWERIGGAGGGRGIIWSLTLASVTGGSFLAHLLSLADVGRGLRMMGLFWWIFNLILPTRCEAQSWCEAQTFHSPLAGCRSPAHHIHSAHNKALHKELRSTVAKLLNKSFVVCPKGRQRGILLKQAGDPVICRWGWGFQGGHSGAKSWLSDPACPGWRGVPDAREWASGEAFLSY